VTVSVKRLNWVRKNGLFFPLRSLFLLEHPVFALTIGIKSEKYVVTTLDIALVNRVAYSRFEEEWREKLLLDVSGFPHP
jgi:hypothetical protein